MKHFEFEQAEKVTEMVRDATTASFEKVMEAIDKWEKAEGVRGGVQYAAMMNVRIAAGMLVTVLEKSGGSHDDIKGTINLIVKSLFETMDQITEERENQKACGKCEQDRGWRGGDS